MNTKNRSEELYEPWLLKEIRLLTPSGKVAYTIYTDGIGMVYGWLSKGCYG